VATTLADSADEVPILHRTTRSALVSCDGDDEVLFRPALSCVPSTSRPFLSSTSCPLLALDLPRRLLAAADALLASICFFFGGHRFAFETGALKELVVALVSGNESIY
jgi:hypothetical protein